MGANVGADVGTRQENIPEPEPQFTHTPSLYVDMPFQSSSASSVVQVESLYWYVMISLTRTVNGTGHTGPSEFCATSI